MSDFEEIIEKLETAASRASVDTILGVRFDFSAIGPGVSIAAEILQVMLPKMAFPGESHFHANPLRDNQSLSPFYLSAGDHVVAKDISENIEWAKDGLLSIDGEAFGLEISITRNSIELLNDNLLLFFDGDQSVLFNVEANDIANVEKESEPEFLSLAALKERFAIQLHESKKFKVGKLSIGRSPGTLNITTLEPLSELESSARDWFRTAGGMISLVEKQTAEISQEADKSALTELINAAASAGYAIAMAEAHSELKPLARTATKSRVGGRKGGRKAASNRAAENLRKWGGHGLEQCIRMRAEMPWISQGRLADEVWATWTLEHPPSRDWLLERIREWERGGTLVKRTPKKISGVKPLRPTS